MVDESASAAGEELTLEAAHTVTKPRRRALWGVLAVVALAAGAVVVFSGGDGTPPRLPVALGSSASREAAAGAMAADMSLAWVTYVAGDDLPALGGEAAAYRLDGAVDEAAVRALADALGMSGDPTHAESVWHLESDDGVLEVFEDAGGSWWYSVGGGIAVGGGSAGCEAGPGADCVYAETGTAVPAPTVAADCSPDGATCETDPGTSECTSDGTDRCASVTTYVEPCPEGAGCTSVGECPPEADCIVPPPIEPTPAANLPSEDEARQIALDLLGATGMDLDDAKVTLDGPYDAWYVMVEPRLDGVPVSGWQASVSVGPEGSILNASGTLGRPERLGDYPLIDTRAAIDRLNDLQGGGFGGGPVPLGAPDGVARDSGVAVAEAPASDDPCAADESTCTTPSAPVEPSTTIAPQCKVQPDGSEICEFSESGEVRVECVELVPAPAVEPSDDPIEPSTDVAADCAQPGVCYDAAPPADAEGAPETTLVSPECTEPYPYPEPEPIEVVLTGAEPVLVLLPSYDGSSEAYLVPGYRFSNDDGVMAEVAAVADDSLAPTTTVPATTETTEPPAPPPTECDTVVEGDGSGTTHTVQTCPQPTEPVRLEPGQTPEVGVGYYVDVDVECAAFILGDQIWRHDVGDLAGWSSPHEGGTFTLDAPDHGTFVGDASAEKTATFVTGTDPDGCSPTPRG